MIYHNFILLLARAAARVFPSGENDTDKTGSSCLFSCSVSNSCRFFVLSHSSKFISQWLISVSQIFTEASQLPVANLLPSSEKANA
jgi:hypothetical protein